MNERRRAVRLATSTDLPAAAAALAAAFMNYAWTRWTVPVDDYAHRLEQLQLLYLTHAQEHGSVIVDDGVTAVAAFLPPDAPPLAPHLEAQVVTLLGDRLAVLSTLTLPEPPPEAWSLATVGVDPEHQGAGLGTAVTAAGLEMVDERAAVVALETSDERNVRLYQRLGFGIDATTDIPDGPVVFSMSRPASAREGSITA